MTDDLLQIGAVCRPHGLGGELRVRLHDPLSTALDGLRHIWLGAEASPEAEPRIQAWQLRSLRRVEGGFYLVSLVGVSDRTSADGLRDRAIFAKRADLPPLIEGEYYVADLIGCKVLLADGETVGTAKAVQDLAGNQLLVVERLNRADALIPLAPEILVSVNLEGRFIHIDPPEGLLDLDKF
jgi:16S rRNA processing protein RimM